MKNEIEGFDINQHEKSSRIVNIDISDEVISILKSKRDEIVFKMKLASKEEVDVLNKRISILEKKLEEMKKRKKTSRVKK